MKICILGPVTTNDYYGGVAVFDEELAKGFRENGWEVILATEQKNVNKTSANNGLVCMTINKNILKRLIQDEKPDYIIASLRYGKYFKIVKAGPQKIYFLHGYFNQRYYGAIKAFIAVLYQKMLIRHCDLVFANSYFTAMINSEFFGIETDAVFHLGVSEQFLKNVEEGETIKEPKSILFVGRLVTAKRIMKLIEAIRILEKDDIGYKLYIIGDGPLWDGITQCIKSEGLNIEMLGRQDQNTTSDYYKRSEIFVSLNPSESFGIVFQEALLSKCKIVCPNTGGQVEYLYKWGNSVTFVNSKSDQSIADGIKNMLAVKEAPLLSGSRKQELSYTSVSKKIIEYFMAESRNK